MAATLTALKACAGGYVGAGGVHPALVEAARQVVSEARESGAIADGFVARCGDDVALICLHEQPPGSAALTTLAREAFLSCGAAAARLAQHAVPANGGPPVERAEIALSGGASEPVVVFLSDKAGAGAFDVHLYRAFADPFTAPSLLSDPSMREGFRFVCDDRDDGTARVFDLPDDPHHFLASVAGGRCLVREVVSRAGSEVAAVASAGSDPVAIVRCEGGLPTVGEALEPFAFPYAIAGWAGCGPLMPVSTIDDAATRLDGPPRVVGLGFQVSSDRLIGPRDLLGDRAFDEARRDALRAADYLRRHGPFAPVGARATRPAGALNGNGYANVSQSSGLPLR